MQVIYGSEQNHIHIITIISVQVIYGTEQNYIHIRTSISVQVIWYRTQLYTHKNYYKCAGDMVQNKTIYT